MKRRTLLTTVGSGAALTLSGCMEDGPAEENNGNETTTDTESHAEGTEESSNEETPVTEETEQTTENNTEEQTEQQDGEEEEEQNTASTADLVLQVEDGENGDAVEETVIVIEHKETGFTRQETTPPNGEVTFGDIHTGEYIVHLEAEWYEEKTTSVVLNEGGGHEAVSIEPMNLQLRFSAVDQFGDPVRYVDLQVRNEEFGRHDFNMESNGELAINLAQRGEYSYNASATNYTEIDTSGTVMVEETTDVTLEFEELVWSLTVHAPYQDSQVTLRRDRDGETTTKTAPPDRAVGFTVYEGDYTVTAGNESKSVRVEHHETVNFQ